MIACRMSMVTLRNKEIWGPEYAPTNCIGFVKVALSFMSCAIDFELHFK